MSETGGPLLDYETEHRLAVVMYGGVSLAVYIGGIASELLSVVRATSPGATDPGRAGLRDDELRGAEPVYRRAARLRRGQKMADFDEDGANATLAKRVIIDVISGTSAGGINGIFLAKALANDQSMDEILKLWVEEGDMARLLNDDESVAGTTLSPQKPPAALLNGRRMYAKLLEAFDGMDASARESRNGSDAPRYDASRVDLFVPTTDIRGETINLPVANAVAREKRHKQRFHFTAEGMAGQRRNELAHADNPVLAYAARCTSSFPFAFEPFTWADASAIAGSRADDAEWDDRLMYIGKDYHLRPMGDGGYLDNKPFTYAVDELTRRQSHLDVKRVLLYVEPDPEKLTEDERRLQSIKPDAMENALAALISIPGYETIREDLERVIARNGRVEQLRGLEDVIQRAISRGLVSTIPISDDEWKSMSDDDLIARRGLGYLAYQKVKIGSVIDSLADLMCTATGIGRPEVGQVIRDVVTAWVRDEYRTPADERQLLLDADIDYRLRKIAFVLRKASWSGDRAVLAARASLGKVYDAYYTMKRTMRDAMGNELKTLRESPWTDERLAEIAPLTGGVRDEAIAELLRDTRRRLEAEPEGKGDLKAYLSEVIGPRVHMLSDTASAAVSAAAESSDSEEARTLDMLYRGFESFDMVKFPIVQHGGVDEAVPVDVVRISPQDMTVKVKLAGTGLAHFGAFLEDDWRRNDIVAGRFNAAETIIRQLVPDARDATRLVAEAHQAIAAEMEEKLRERIASAQLRQAGNVRLNRPQRRRLERAVRAVVTREKLPALLAEGKVYGVDELDRAKQLRSAGRAGVIIEQILRESAVRAKWPFPAAFRWAAYATMVLTQIAIPRSFHQTIAVYWGRLLALVFGVLAIAGYVADVPGLMRTGIRGFVVIAGVGYLALLLSRWAGERLRLGLHAASWIVLGGIAVVLAPRAASAAYRALLELSKLDEAFIYVAIGVTLAAMLIVVFGDLRARALGLRRLVRSWGVMARRKYGLMKQQIRAYGGKPGFGG